MQKEDWIELFKLIPEHYHSKLVLNLTSGADVCVDTLLRFEREFLVFRGRFGGSTDEGRGFFVPYQNIVCCRIETTVRGSEMLEMFGVTPSEQQRKAMDGGMLEESTSISSSTTLAMPAEALGGTMPPAPGPSNAPATLVDGATAKHNLLEKIRQAKLAASANTAKPK